jgi:hypothetical protein
VCTLCNEVINENSRFYLADLIDPLSIAHREVLFTPRACIAPPPRQQIACEDPADCKGHAQQGLSPGMEHFAALSEHCAG